MKRILTLIFTFILLLASPVSAYAASLSLNPANGTYNVGCTFQVKIDIDASGLQVDAVDAKILFDNTKLTPSQFAVNPSTIFPDTPTVVDAAAGKITVSGLAAISQPFTGKGTLATLSFQVKPDAAPGPTFINFDFDQANVSSTRDSNIVERGTVAELLSSVTNGAYTVGSGTGCGGASTSVPGQVVNAAAGSTNTGTSGTGTRVGAPLTNASNSATLNQNNVVLSPGGHSPGNEWLTYTFAILGSLLVIFGAIGIAIL